MVNFRVVRIAGVRSEDAGGGERREVAGGDRPDALYILPITWLATAIGLAVSSPEAASGATFLFLFLPYLSSAFVPTDTMPAPVRWFSARQPITPIIETIRVLLNGGSPGTAALWAVGWCLLLLLGFVAIAGWLFRRTTRG